MRRKVLTSLAALFAADAQHELSYPGASLGAAFSAVLVAAGLGIFLGESRDPMDVDGNGTVDMVDAYMLARQRGDASRVEDIARRSVELR